MVDNHWKLIGNPNTNPPTNFLGTTDNHPLVLKTNGTEAMRIDATGNVGIGTTNPGFKLQVTAPDQLGLVIQGPEAAAGAGLQLQTTGPIGKGWELLATGVTSAQGQDKFNIRNLNTAADDLTITSDDKVGIGTTTPRTSLHVLERISTGLDFTSAGAITFFPPDGFAWFHIDNGPSGGRPIGRLRISYGNNPGDNEVMSVFQNGLVGINTINPDPAARLTVEGVGPDLGGPFDAVGVVGKVINPAQRGVGSQTAGVRGINDEGHGVQGQSNSHIGVEGTSNRGTAVYAESQGGVGVWGVTRNGPFAGFFQGDVRVAGTLTKAGGGFKIDHPLDPANKYLNHSFVESPEMKNIYDGVIMLDAQGEALVELPQWFEALNQDFRYQLTAIGAPGPNLYIAEELSHSRFKIAGGTAGMKVSWQVTGIRKDPWAQAHVLAVEETKPDNERGYYLYPELYDHPEEKGLMWAYQPEMMHQKKGQRQQMHRDNS